MPCDRALKPQQTIKQRADEIRTVVTKAVQALISGRVKAKIGPTGAVAFTGLTDDERDGVTDNCLFRRILATGGALANAQIAKAEALAGRPVNRQAVAHGHHSHDGGQTWHHHKG